MLKHIVFWKFMDEACGHTKEENMDIIKDGLMSLVGKVPSLISAEMGKDVLHSDMSYDMCLICTFEDLNGMLEYKDHPEHVKVASYIAKVKTDRAVIDYEF
ncbi:MAG: Dabb family protein [Clostridia bacterium]|nr:Dabb family protein [Clostridia bacterium]